MSLTRAQSRVLVAIEKLIRDHGFSPSFKEIGQAADLRSLESVFRHVHALEREGFLRLTRSRRRAIEIVPKNLRAWKSCAAGHPLVFFSVEKCPVCTVLQHDSA